MLIRRSLRPQLRPPARTYRTSPVARYVGRAVGEPILLSYVHRARLLRAGAFALGAGLLFHAGLVVSCCSTPPSPPGPRTDASPPATVDRHLEVARRYAPIVLQETHPRRGREDLPSNLDFDGDLVGRNNWEAFERFRLLPTVYYALLETETHLFLTYHLFHARDWSPFPLGLQDTHENDGENLQVVVEKASGLPVLLYAQAHYRGRAYANDRARYGDGEERIRGGFLPLDGEGRPVPAGTHVAVFVESQGHGIYGSEDRSARISIATDGATRFRKNSGLLLRPARDGEEVREPDSFTSGTVPYRLESTVAKLWPGLREGTILGNGALFDWPCPYEDGRVRLERLPRAYDGNRYSGPLGNDRGISPFAVSFGFSCGEVGSLFFDPASRWNRAIRVPEPWSTTYLDDPFGPTPPAPRR